MIRRFGQLKFRLRPCVSLHQYGYAGPADRLITLKEYLTSTFASRRCVLFENDFDAERLELLDGFAIPQLLSEIHGSPILSVGRRNTGIGFHRHSAAWLAQLQGRKLWFLLPGGRRPPERAPWQYLTHRPKRMICCVAHPGEIILVPAGWWHATWNLDDFSLAAGWEEGNSATWGPEMHAIVNGTDLPLGFEVSVPALCLAARSGRVETLELLLQRGGSELLRKVQTSAASTAVAAARSGHLRILSHLWEKGITSALFQVSQSGSTALHEAARCGRVDVIDWLLVRQADVQQRDSGSTSALQVAAEFGHPGVIRKLLQHKADAEGREETKNSTALMLAALHGHVECVLELLQADPCLVHGTDRKGRSSLHLAAMRGHQQVVLELLKASAEVHARDQLGRNALHLATLRLTERDATSEKIELVDDAHLPVVLALLEASADVEMQDALGKSPLDYAGSVRGQVLEALEARKTGICRL
ncbi:Kinase D-interacting substrate of 220 kDa B (Ankyrin repeat-rich membrane-spanning protein B) [Durusdinium trenchii]